ncbi:MAG: TonB family protein [Bacteroidales bacterium]|nr:TonB family protein [Bacteroidales bacterium]
MSKVDIISQEWCDLVFEGRNKEYGAYDLRSKAGKRHLWAIIDILIAILIIAAIIFTYAKASEAIRATMGGEEQMVTELSELKKDEPKKEEKKIEVPQEQPKQELQKVAVKASIAFTVPEIVDQVDETKKIKNQEELSRSTISIAAQDYAGDSKDGINIDDLKENQSAGGSQAPPEEDTKVYTVVEQAPAFPGGDAALLKYVNSHIKYPAIAQEQEIQGVVTLRFVVLEDGRVGEVQVVKSLESHCDAEAIRVVKSLPRFTPGKQQGKPVRVWFTLPIRYVIQ